MTTITKTESGPSMGYDLYLSTKPDQHEKVNVRRDLTQVEPNWNAARFIESAKR
jgi:hypothetical protein